MALDPMETAGKPHANDFREERGSILAALVPALLQIAGEGSQVPGSSRAGSWGPITAGIQPRAHWVAREAERAGNLTSAHAVLLQRYRAFVASETAFVSMQALLLSACQPTLRRRQRVVGWTRRLRHPRRRL
jgi:hypothetical protein